MGPPFGRTIGSRSLGTFTTALKWREPVVRPFEIREFNGFDPDAVKILHQAYTEACIALHVFAGDRLGKEAVAMRVIDLARTGVIEAAALRDRVLLEARVGL
jgi:hypothetical protein